MKLITINSNNEPYYSEDFIKGFKCGAQRQFEADKSDADRPQGKWIKFGLGRGTRILFCTNCERRIEVPLSQGDSNYDFCPNCGAKMKGADDEADEA